QCAVRKGVVISVGTDEHDRLAGPLLDGDLGLLRGLFCKAATSCIKEGKDEQIIFHRRLHRKSATTDKAGAASWRTEWSLVRAPIRKSTTRRVQCPFQIRRAGRCHTCADRDTT